MGDVDNIYLQLSADTTTTMITLSKTITSHHTYCNVHEMTGVSVSLCCSSFKIIFFYHGSTLNKITGSYFKLDSSSEYNSLQYLIKKINIFWTKQPFGLILVPIIIFYSIRVHEPCFCIQIKTAFGYEIYNIVQEWGKGLILWFIYFCACVICDLVRYLCVIFFETIFGQTVRLSPFK